MTDLTHLEHTHPHPQVRHLWRAVILRAVLDATAAATAKCSKVSVSERSSARLFLTENHGAFRTSRERVCQAADMCPRLVRKRALELIAETDREALQHQAQAGQEAARRAPSAQGAVL